MLLQHLNSQLSTLKQAQPAQLFNYALRITNYELIFVFAIDKPILKWYNYIKVNSERTMYYGSYC